MTIEKLLANLREQLKAIESTIQIVESYNKHVPHREKAKKILASVNSNKKKGKGAYKGKHWSQTPEGKAKMSARMKKLWKDGVFGKRNLS